MSRNIINTMNKIFEALKSKLSDEDRERVQNHARYIEASGEEEVVKKIVMQAKIIATQTKDDICCITYENNKFIVFPAKYQDKIQNIAIGEFIERYEQKNLNQEIFQGMGMLAIAEGAIKARHLLSSLEILDKCLGLPEEDNCFNFLDLCELFEDFAVLKIDDGMFPLVYKEDLTRFVALLHLISNLSDTNYANLNELILLPGSRSISWNILNYYDSNQFEFQFLQIYQCLEYLFIITVAIDLEKKYNIEELKAINIAADNTFKRSEKDNLIIVIHHCPDTIIEQYYNFLKQYPQFKGNSDTVKADYIADHIYQIRCHIAHLRFKQNNLLQNINQNEELSKLISVTLSIFQKLNEKICNYNTIMNIWTNF